MFDFEMFDPRRYFYVDCETTGLEEHDEIYGISWIYKGVQRAFKVEHDTKPSQWVLESGNYPSNDSALWSSRDHVVQTFLDHALSYFSTPGNVHLTAANPAFDHQKISLLFKQVGVKIPYHYHLIDVETMVMTHAGLAVPPKLEQCRKILGLPGENRAPHTERHDVREVKLVHEAVVKAQSELRSQVKFLESGESDLYH